MATENTFHATRLEIVDLNGELQVNCPIKHPYNVFIGPNGSHKSTCIFMLYLFLSRQWDRLKDFEFNEISVTFSDGKRFTVSNEDCTRYVEYKSHSSPYLDRYSRRLREENVYHTFMKKQRFTPKERAKIAQALNIKIDEVHKFKSHYTSRLEKFEFSERISELDIHLERKLTTEILFLPTYRRIEQDFQKILPKLNERIRRYDGSDFIFERRSTNYHEVIQFGMDDIEKLWKDASSEIDRYARTQLNQLAARYLRDVIRNSANTYEQRTFESLSQDQITKIINRVSEDALSLSDKEHLNSLVTNIKDRAESDLEENEKYVAHYFENLIELSTSIQSRENNLRSLSERLSEYLRPRKKAVYVDANYSIKIINEKGKEIKLSMLSSGEKQVISILSTLYLGPSIDGYFVIIDEPELSLSVPWQEMLLHDMANAPKTSQIIATTHSPFIYEGFADDAIIDVGEYIDYV